MERSLVRYRSSISATVSGVNGGRSRSQSGSAETSGWLNEGVRGAMASGNASACR